MIIDKKIANHNIVEFFENPHDIFVADANNNLRSISKFNLVGRFIEWFKDLYSKGKRSAHTDQVFRATLEMIQINIDQDPKNNFYFASYTPGLPHFLRYGVDYFNRPMSALADKIMTSSLDRKPGIHEIAMKIKIKTLDILKGLSEQEKDELFKYPLV